MTGAWAPVTLCLISTLYTLCATPHALYTKFMPIQKVDTFEHDIADEIRAKDASLTDIATAVGDIGNEPATKTGPTLFVIIIIILFVCGLIGAAVAGYVYYKNVEAMKLEASSKLTRQNVPRPTVSLQAISSTLDGAIGSFVVDVKKTNNGYNLKLNSYPPVFLYMIKNEEAYIAELEMLFRIKKIVQATSTKITQPVTPSLSTSTSTASSTLRTGNATTSTTTLTEIIPVAPAFEDVTLNNQNMRIWRNGSSTVVYAFINKNNLAISSSTDGILEIRNDILR